MIGIWKPLEVRKGQGWDGEFLFALEMQHSSASHQDLQPGTGR